LSAPVKARGIFELKIEKISYSKGLRGIVCLDPGHTTPPSYTGAPGPLEWPGMCERIANRYVAEEVAVILRRTGLTVVKTMNDMDGSGAMGMSGRANVAIAAKADVLVSIHHDQWNGMEKDSKGRWVQGNKKRHINKGLVLFGGEETAQVKLHTKKLGTYLVENLRKSLWYPFEIGTFKETVGRPITFTDLLVNTSKRGIAAVLIECNFMSAKAYTDKAMTEGWGFIAGPIANGILDYLQSR